MSEPILKKIHLNGVDLAYFERGERRADRPTLLFVHATGFHGRIWDRIIESLPGFHTVALEQRGHGRSQRVVISHWKEFAEDIVAFVDALELNDLIGIGHSMGAHGMVDAAARCDAFSRLVLLDPTISAPETYAEGAPAQAPQPFEGPHPAAKRRNRFASVEEMMQRLLPKSAFGVYEPRIFEDYCRYGLVPSPDGGLELACHPETEASVYMTARTNEAIYERVRALQIPVTVVRAQVRPADSPVADFSASPTWPGLVGEFKHGREIHLENCTHFIPMQVPDFVVDVINEEIEAWAST